MIPLVALSRTEHIGDIAVNANDTTFNLATQGGLLPNDRWLYGLRCEFTFRATNPASGNPTGTQADSTAVVNGSGYLERFQIQGTHRLRGQLEPFLDLRGSDLAALNVHWYSRTPYGTPTSLSVAASGTNDVRFIVDVPFVPESMPWWEKIKYLLDAPNYDALKLTITSGSDKSIFTGQTTAPTFSAIASATGNPQFRVAGLFAMGGKQAFEGYIPGRKWLTWFENVSTDLTNTNNRQRINNCPKGYALRSVTVKTGVKSTAVNAGENIYNTLSNSILANLKINRGIGRQIRHFADFFLAQQDFATRQMLSAQPPTGYAMIDFAPNDFLGEVLNTKQYTAGPTGDVDLFVEADVTGAASQGAVFIYEELRETPVTVSQTATGTR